MRDYRDAKAMAQTIRAALAAKNLKISNSESLELMAAAFGAADWNTLSAAIKAAGSAPPAAAQPSDDKRALDGLARALGLEDWDKLMQTVRAERPAEATAARQAGPPRWAPALQRPDRTGFSRELGRTLHRAVAEAEARNHGHTTLEHLLLALIDDADASEVMRACRVDLGALRASLTSYLDDQPSRLPQTGDETLQPPTAAFQRTIQRAVIHVQSAGRREVTGANALVAIFSERESHAAFFLQQQRISRHDAVNFIAHGVRKDGGKAA